MVRAAAVLNRWKKVCGVFLFNGGICVKYILSKDKGVTEQLFNTAALMIGMPEEVYIGVFNYYMGMVVDYGLKFEEIREYDIDNFKEHFDNISYEIKKDVDDTIPQEEP